MRVPPYYRKPSWQRFIAGMAIGGAISWCIFLYIHGDWQETYTKLIESQQKEIKDLVDEKKIWQEEYEAQNKKILESLTIQQINVKILNWEKYKLDQFSVFQTEDSIRDDISMMLAKDLETAGKSKELIEKLIENKPIKINDKRYKLKVTEMIIWTTLTIELDISFDE